MSKKTATILAVSIFVALLAACVVAIYIPDGEPDVSFEYEVVLKEINLDADGHAVSLTCSLYNDSSSTVIVSLEKVKKAYRPSGKVSFKKLNIGDLLFVSVDPEGGVRNTDPPTIVADMVMVKSIGPETTAGQ